MIQCFLAAVALAVTWIVWNVEVTGRMAPGAVAFFCLLSFLSWRCGVRIERCVGRRWGAAFELLAGFLTLNTLLFLVRVATPWSMGVHVGILVGLLASDAIWAWRERTRGRPAAETPDAQTAWLELLAVALALVGSTLWSHDCLHAVAHTDREVVFRPWTDIFVHARLVAQIASPELPMQDVWVAGQPAPMYHYASYLFAAILTRVSPTSEFQASVGFLVPMGLLCACLAAGVLGRAWFGPWAAVAAVAVLLLPDPSLQFTGNYYLGYHWLTQVSHGLGFGTALAALAWLAMFEACRTGRWPPLAASAAILCGCLLYKVHLLLANAIVLGLYPAFFLPGWPRWRRVAWAVAVVAGVAAAAAFSAAHPRLPTFVFGNAFRPVYLQRQMDFSQASLLHGYLPRFTAGDAFFPQIAKGGLMLLAWTFGPLALAAAIVCVCLRRRCPPAAAWFPLLIAANYLLFALGLEANRGVQGTDDEFLHRPLVWAYFVLAAWTGAAAVKLVAELAAKRPQPVRWMMAALLLAACVLPWHLGKELQLRMRNGEYAKARHVPAGLVACCEYVRLHSRVDDVVQDSQDNATGLTAGLAARPVYLTGDWLRKAADDFYRARQAAYRGWLSAVDARSVQAFAASAGLRFFIYRTPAAPPYAADTATRDNRVNWPPAILDHPVYEAGGYRVYRFY